MARSCQISHGREGHGLEDGSNVFEKIRNGFTSLIPKFAQILSTFIAFLSCEATKNWCLAAGRPPAIRQH
jgi:hypothetical protein